MSATSEHYSRLSKRLRLLGRYPCQIASGIHSGHVGFQINKHHFARNPCSGCPRWILQSGVEWPHGSGPGISRHGTAGTAADGRYGRGECVSGGRRHGVCTLGQREKALPAAGRPHLQLAGTWTHTSGLPLQGEELKRPASAMKMAAILSVCEKPRDAARSAPQVRKLRLLSYSVSECSLTYGFTT